MIDYFNKILKNFKNVLILKKVSDQNQLILYFKYIIKYRKNLDKKTVLQKKHLLLDPNTHLEQKKQLIVQLAAIDNIDAYNTLKQYNQNPDPELADWASIALQEIKALLESSLTGEPTVLISSGLGGEKHRLRYFFVLFANKNQTLKDWQKNLIHKEISFCFEKSDAILENISFSDSFVKGLALIPFNSDFSVLFEKIINNINQFGNFLANSAIIRTQNILSDDQILSIIQKLNSDTDSNTSITFNFDSNDPLDLDPDLDENLFLDISELEDLQFPEFSADDLDQLLNLNPPDSSDNPNHDPDTNNNNNNSDNKNNNNNEKNKNDSDNNEKNPSDQNN